jgi:hypothetical protein
VIEVGDIDSLGKYTVPSSAIGLIDLQEIISSTIVVQRTLNTVHDCKYLLLFKSASNDLNCNRQTSHFLGVVMLVCALCYTIQFLDVESRRERVLDSIDMCNWNDSGGVIELQHY